MARHRSSGDGKPSPALEAALRQRTSRADTAHRLPVPSAAARGRVVVAAFAAGAFVAAGQTIDSNTASAVPTEALLLSASDEVDTVAGVGGPASSPEYLPVTRSSVSATTEAVAAMAKGQRLLAEREAREAEALRPKFARPANGRFTSGYGARWGTTHWGIDIANRIGTPILAVADGVVAESGPASGFGLWIRLVHDDGTSTIYGHINRSLVWEGQRVQAGDTIAEMGNRGYSTGPHLHFEVWDANGQKINPTSWLRQKGIDL